MGQVKQKDFVIEKVTGEFIAALEVKGGAPIYTLPPEKMRAVLEEAQSGKVMTHQVKIDDLNIPGPDGKQLSIRILRPLGSKGPLPITMYFHGAGWVMGSKDTHDRLIREICVGTDTAVVFVSYDRSPEARFPVAIEQCYAATKYVVEQQKSLNLDSTRLVVAGDSVGGNLTIAVTLLSLERNGPKIDKQVLFYPVTQAELNSESYKKYAEGPWLTKPAMEYFWNAYEPDVNARKQPLQTPMNIPLDILKKFPPTLIITAENDVLRDEGEAFARRLMEAGAHVTAVRLIGTIHDFVMLNALATTPATKQALAIANAFIH